MHRAFSLLLSLAAFDTAAATVQVTSLGDGAGVCPSAGSCTLRAAIAAAQSGDEIVFDPALPYPAQIPLVSSLTVDKNLTLVGPGADRLAIRGSASERVLTLSAGTLLVQGLTLSHGTQLAPAGGNGGIGVAGQSGMAAEGGCVRSAAGTQLVLDRVALHTCSARGGDGGHGGNGMNAFSMAGAGGTGGLGGNAHGGAIYSAGSLTLLQSSIRDASAQAGAGGDGGHGGTAQTSGQGSGGGGGGGGTARGGGIYVASFGALVLRNSTLVDAYARGGHGGDGGDGGNGTGTAGDGGNGGAARGGELFVNSSVMVADVEFATLGASDTAGGLGGAPGDSLAGGTGGTPGTVDGELLFNASTVRVRGAAFVGGAPPGDCEGTLLASGSNADSDDSCVGFDIGADYQGHFAPVAIEAGQALLRPRAGSPVVDAAPDCLDLDGVALAEDQRGGARPFDGDADSQADCDLGALEYTPAVFADGFEG